MWEVSAPSSQFCCEPKTALKSPIFFFKVTYFSLFLESPSCELSLGATHLASDIIVSHTEGHHFWRNHDSMNIPLNFKNK